MKEIKDIKEFLKSIKEGLLCLQELTNRLLPISKDTSTDVGKARLTIDGFK